MLKCLTETEQKFYAKMLLKEKNKSMQQIIYTVFTGPYYSFKGHENSTRIKNRKLQKL